VLASLWLVYDPPAATRHLIFVNYVPTWDSRWAASCFVTYLRKLAALADARPVGSSGNSRDSRNRNEPGAVLHTPHRLLQELQDELRSQLADVGSRPAACGQARRGGRLYP
jgi:hypothetical protein